jgi:hypothetical protein
VSGRDPGQVKRTRSVTVAQVTDLRGSQPTLRRVRFSTPAKPSRPAELRRNPRPFLPFLGASNSQPGDTLRWRGNNQWLISRTWCQKDMQRMLVVAIVCLSAGHALGVAQKSSPYQISGDMRTVACVSWIPAPAYGEGYTREKWWQHAPNTRGRTDSSLALDWCRLRPSESAQLVSTCAALMHGWMTTARGILMGRWAARSPHSWRNWTPVNFPPLTDVLPAVKEDFMRQALPRVLIGCLLVIVFLAGAAWAGAQRRFQEVLPGSPLVLSGSDLGFRMVGRKGDTVVGSLVVRVNGEWVATEYGYGLKPVTK